MGTKLFLFSLTLLPSLSYTSYLLVHIHHRVSQNSHPSDLVGRCLHLRVVHPFDPYDYSYGYFYGFYDHRSASVYSHSNKKDCQEHDEC